MGECFLGLNEGERGRVELTGIDECEEGGEEEE